MRYWIKLFTLAVSYLVAVFRSQSNEEINNNDNGQTSTTTTIFFPFWARLNEEYSMSAQWSNSEKLLLCLIRAIFIEFQMRWTCATVRFVCARQVWFLLVRLSWAVYLWWLRFYTFIIDSLSAFGFCTETVIYTVDHKYIESLTNLVQPTLTLARPHISSGWLNWCGLNKCVPDEFIMKLDALFESSENQLPLYMNANKLWKFSILQY